MRFTSPGDYYVQFVLEKMVRNEHNNFNNTIIMKTVPIASPIAGAQTKSNKNNNEKSRKKESQF